MDEYIHVHHNPVKEFTIVQDVTWKAELCHGVGGVWVDFASCHAGSCFRPSSFFRIKSDYPTWGLVIYQGLSQGALYGSRCFWVLEPLALLLLTVLVLERVLNPR